MTGFSDDDRRWMQRALELAGHGPAADPNPRVGCVLVRDGRLVAEGYHRGAGTAHAEADALRTAGEAARGCIAYVTLEPCAHVGRTAACAQALIDARVAEVIFAQADPHPVAAGGANRLRAAGIPTRAGLEADRAEALNERWSFAVVHGRPWVTWKFAATLDGRVAAADGTSRWITGEQARAEVHRLRAQAAAIVVGTGTVLADDPHLTVRSADGRVDTCERQPLRVVVGDRDVPPGSHVLDGAAPTVRLRGHDPGQVLSVLNDRQIRHVLLEAGPTLAAAFCRADLIDEVVGYLAPRLLGAGPGIVADLGITSIAQSLDLHLHDVRRVGADVRLTLRRS